VKNLFLVSLICLSAFAQIPKSTTAPSSAATSFVSGAQALYLFNEGSGTTLTDTSGNARNGTLTGSPTWQNMGLAFASNSQYVTLPAAALNGAGTIQVWFSAQRPESTNSAYPALIGTDTYFALGLNNATNGTPFAYSVGLNPASQPVDKVPAGLASLSYIPSTGAMYINGLRQVVT
jgi:hypothetical protein